ncbi:MAG: alpha/beta hydrolase fold domain-containing protein [Steroidobacteraceae bacterium]
MEWFWNHYVPDKALRRDFRAAPLHTADLSGVAPAIIQTAEYDPLPHEGNAYAERLRKAGVKVTSKCIPGLIHGFAGLTTNIKAAEDAVTKRGGYTQQLRLKPFVQRRGARTAAQQLRRQRQLDVASSVCLEMALSR